MLVTRTCMQRVRAISIFTIALQGFMLRGHVCTLRPPWRILFRYNAVLPMAGKETARNPLRLKLAGDAAGR